MDILFYTINFSDATSCVPIEYYIKKKMSSTLRRNVCSPKPLEKFLMSCLKVKCYLPNVLVNLFASLA
ncbi:hypothetical protein VNO77_05272 [Canavalia gladiata]|uniref:Uncharacterized protein n=1 Tax=Canavalia gladiata TaxID=3824 RepID=A0AAN9N389_CANGL